MTTAERLRAAANANMSLAGYEMDEAADELDRNQDTIAQLRAERDTMAAQIEGLKRGWNAEAKKCADLKAKLAHVEADAAAMTTELQWVHGVWSDCFHDAASDCRICRAYASNSGQRLLDELAELRKDHKDVQILTNSAIEDLRATAQRRLELLRKCEWSMPCAFDFRNQCPICHGYIAEHKPGCPLAAELNQNGPAEYTEPIHDHGAYGTAMKKESK